MMKGLTRIVSFLPREDWIVVGWVLAIKVLLFSFGAKSYAVLWDNYIANPYQWFGIWDQWHSVLSAVSAVGPSGCVRQ